jgi:hypothetical protein
MYTAVLLAILAIFGIAFILGGIEGFARLWPLALVILAAGYILQGFGLI